MTQRSVRILTMLSVIVLWVAGMAQAQFAPHYVKVSVPFDFTFNNTLFPAGKYVLVCSPGQVELRDAVSHVVASAIPHSVESLQSLLAPKLVFVTANGTRELRQVWAGDPHRGYEFGKSRPANLEAKQQTRTQVAGGGNK